jgi:amino acid transporter
MTNQRPGNDSVAQPRQALTLLDASSIIVGIIIGSAIYRISPQVVGGVGNWVAKIAGNGAMSANWLTAAVLGVWILGGLIALIGAMCYAELGTAFPRVGGTYVYLSESMGRTVGFAFAWAEFWIVRPGNVGAVAFVLADYGERIFSASSRQSPLVGTSLAAGAIVLMAAFNAIGLRTGKRTQNVLTALKVAGLMAIVAVGFSVPSSAESNAVPVVALQGTLGLALLTIMFAYGGWTDISFVAAEVRDPERNIFRALLLGTTAVVAIYLLVNLAFMHALGVGGVAGSKAVAADVLTLRLGQYGSRAISLLVVISCLGAINGMLLTGARVFYALGTHHPTFRWLGAWNEQTGVPLRSLVMQTLVTLGLVVVCREQEGFERLVVFTAPFYWGFIALAAIALIALRLHGATGSATFRVPLFPLTPIIFAVSSGFMVYAGFKYAFSRQSVESLWGLAVVVSGLVVGWVDWRARHR